MSSHNSAAPLGDCQSRSDSDRDSESRCGPTRVCARGPGPAAQVTGAGCRRRSCPPCDCRRPRPVWLRVRLTRSIAGDCQSELYSLRFKVQVAAASRGGRAEQAGGARGFDDLGFTDGWSWCWLTIKSSVTGKSHGSPQSPFLDRRYSVSKPLACKFCHDLHRARCFRWLHKRLQLQRRERNL